MFGDELLDRSVLFRLMLLNGLWTGQSFFQLTRSLSFFLSRSSGAFTRSTINYLRPTSL